MNEEQPVTALSMEEEAEARRYIGVGNCTVFEKRLLATLDREREAVADLRASLAAEVRRMASGTICRCGAAKSYHGNHGKSLPAPEHEYEPRYPEGTVQRRAVLRLIEGDTDARER